MVLRKLRHMQHIARGKFCRFSILGDFNLQEGGRWGYSAHSQVHQFDCRMQEWILTFEFHEVKSEQVNATWNSCLQPLDQALVYPVNMQVSPLILQWAQSDSQCLIMC